ncbi:DUF4160 domain-containing protein [Candidatus Thiosymbion oneisti]|uniref:DUF4160 domain-containing protein n=1 Tax=Candidatus Thiosymbion oneisti TaxID=589554 RepID=UPI00210BC805|nr:DUF4160 domain-containing protein [Candidatus Thiosymbion oneisti]
MHVHVASGSGEAKFWLEPEIELAKNCRFSRKNLKQIEIYIEAHHDELVSAWKTYFKC